LVVRHRLRAVSPAHRLLVGLAVVALVATATFLGSVSVPRPRPAAAAGVAYVKRVASATSGTASTSVRLVVGSPVASGDSVIVSLLLSSTSITGAVTATDTAGDTYAVDRDVNDGGDGDRVLVLSTHSGAPLATGSAITLTFPRSAEYHVAADEISGIGALDRSAGASGRTSPFSSTAVVPSQSGELVWGVVGNESGGSPAFASGWTAEPLLTLSTDHLGTAYQVPSSTAAVAATGTTTGVWMSAVAAYLPATAAPPPPPVDNPPVANLKVTPTSGTAPLAVTADASGSTDTDTTPIATYQFNFGDGTTPAPQTSPTATHTYNAAGTYTVSVTATDTANKTSNTATTTVTVTTAPPPAGSSVTVYAGYYDTHHAGNPQPKPVPWQGSPNVVFVGQADGSSGGWDSSAVRVDNLTNAPLTGVVVTVDIGSSHFAMWGTNTIPVGDTLIVTQMGLATFDGSDENPGGCYGCSAATCTPPLTTLPVIHVTIGGVTTDYTDRGQILNTHGVDSAGCPYNGNRNDESEAWQAVPAG
jgi:PKD repeat protein